MIGILGSIGCDKDLQIFLVSSFVINRALYRASSASACFIPRLDREAYFAPLYPILPFSPSFLIPVLMFCPALMPSPIFSEDVRLALIRFRHTWQTARLAVGEGRS